jgi:hypothetical protein
LKVEADPSDVARASRPLGRGHPARVLIDFTSSLARERDAPATAGETPALRRLSHIHVQDQQGRHPDPVRVRVLGAWGLGKEQYNMHL